MCEVREGSVLAGEARRVAFGFRFALPPSPHCWLGLWLRAWLGLGLGLGLGSGLGFGFDLWLRASCTCMRRACQVHRISARRCARGAREAHSRWALRALAARRRCASASCPLSCSCAAWLG